MANGRHLFYGILAGLGILTFYISVLTLFQGFGFAMYEFKRLWVWIVPLAAGFGTQIGLYTAIRSAASASLTAEVAGTGTLSGGAMIACCSHFLLNIIPIIGLSGIAMALMAYQKVFFSIGIVSSIIGIGVMLNHKNNMRINDSQSFATKKLHHGMKGGKC